MGAGALSPGVKRPGREADHSPPASAEVKKMWIYTSTPINLYGVVLNSLSTGTTFSFALWLAIIRVTVESSVSASCGCEQWKEEQKEKEKNRHINNI
jgi:hypothetical protein